MDSPEFLDALAKLTPRRQQFVREYLIDLNATQAAIRAGYSAKTAGKIGTENLHKPVIAEAIALGQAARAARTEITADRVVLELARLAFGDIRRVFAPDGRLKRPDEIDDEAAAAVASIKVTTRNVGEGEVEHVAEIKAWDKNTALTTLARHLGMLNDKLKVQGDAENPLTLLVREIQGRALPVVADPHGDER